MPDCTEPVKPGQAGRLPLTQEIVSQLETLRAKSGLGPYQLFQWVEKQRRGVPGGLTPIQLDECLNRRVKTVNPQLLAFAIERWEAAIAECRSP